MTYNVFGGTLNLTQLNANCTLFRPAPFPWKCTFMAKIVWYYYISYIIITSTHSNNDMYIYVIKTDILNTL